MAVIDVTEVATAIGRPISDNDEVDQVTQWIADVELLIGARLGDITTLDQDLLRYVVREAVIARMRYREDRNSQRGNTSEDDTDTGEEHYFLRILNPWWALLSPPTNAITSAFSIRPGFESDSAQWAVTTPPSQVDGWSSEPWV